MIIDREDLPPEDLDTDRDLIAKAFGVANLHPATRAQLAALALTHFAPTDRVQWLDQRAKEEQAEVILQAACRPAVFPAVLAEVTHRQALGMTRLHALQSVAGDVTTGRWDPR